MLIEIAQNLLITSNDSLDIMKKEYQVINIKKVSAYWDNQSEHKNCMKKDKSCQVEDWKEVQKNIC